MGMFVWFLVRLGSNELCDQKPFVLVTSNSFIFYMRLVDCFLFFSSLAKRIK